MKKRFTPFHDPTKELELAIEKLEKFTQQNAAEPIPHIQHLDMKEGKLILTKTSPLQKTMDLASYLITTAFSDKARKEKCKKSTDIQNEVLEAVEVVKSHYLLIEKLIEGTPHQRQIAASAMAVINRYNEIISRKCPPTWSLRIVGFLYEKMGWSVNEKLKSNPIELPAPIAFQGELPKKISQQFESPLTVAASQKITSLMQQKAAISPNTLVSKQEEDVFRMKAITQFQKLGFRFDEMKSFKYSPISASSADSIVSMFQTIVPFPGELVEMKGSFRRNIASGSHSIPIPDSFQLISKSIQTGFPHPCQHTGWALANQLIPAFPQNMDQLTYWQPLNKRKNDIAKDLLPNGKYLAKAKELLKLKKRCFEENLNEFLALQKTLSQAIVSCSQASSEKNKFDLFYSIVEKQSSPYDYLAETYQIINENLISRPYERLKKSWLERNNCLFNLDPDIRYKNALKILEDEFENILKEFEIQKDKAISSSEAAAFDYLICLGETLKQAIVLIILQEFSEIIGFVPPALNDFEQRVQASVYKQLKEFLDDLEKINLEQFSEKNSYLLNEHLKEQLKSDIEIFTKESFEEIEDPSVRIVNELEVYYTSRYFIAFQDKALDIN